MVGENQRRCLSVVQDLSGHQIPYKCDRVIRSERSLLVQVRASGVEADNQVVRTRTTKNNGKLLPLLCRL